VNEPNSKNDKWGLLTTLAKGDNFSKLMMAAILLLQGGGILNTNKQASSTRSELDEARVTAAKQIQVIYDHQRYWTSAMKGLQHDNSVIMEKLGVGKSTIPDPPVYRKKLPQSADEPETYEEEIIEESP
jgi:hypothetical protein